MFRNKEFRASRFLGLKQYELTDHLGNVNVSVLDRLSGTGDGILGQYTYLSANISSLTDYYPFGMPMLSRNESVENYRFGFNKQEQENEIYGKGVLNSAEYWMYDTRIGRRWNMDPKPNPTLSHYATFSNNPIMNTDIMGDTASVSYKYSDKGAKNSTAYFVDNKWIDKTSRATIDLDKLKGNNSRKLMEGYSEMHQISDLEELTTMVNNLDKPVNLSMGIEARFHHKKYFEEGIINIELNSYYNGDKAIFQFGDNRSNLVSIMSHELGHLYDAINFGTINLYKMFPYDQKTNLADDGTSSEFIAMYFENLARNHYGYGLRTKYSPESEHLKMTITPVIENGTIIKYKMISSSLKRVKELPNNYKK